MFCPNCAAKNNSGQKFCRSCGMNLEQTNLSISEQFGQVENVDQNKWDTGLDMIGKIGFGGFCAVTGVGTIWLIYTIVSKMILSGTQPVIGVLLARFQFRFADLIFVYSARQQRRQVTQRIRPAPLRKEELALKTKS